MMESNKNIDINKKIHTENLTQATAAMELNNLEELIMKDQHISTMDLNKYIRKTIDLEKYFLQDGRTDKKNWLRIQRINKYLQQIQIEQHHLKNNILTIVATIFLPLGVIVGYFGMNFRSMGSPTLKTGIFTTDKAQIYVFLLCIIASCIILFLFYILQYGSNFLF